MAAPCPRSALALDVGRRRIGLAGCDPLGLTVTALPALARGTFASDLQQLLPLLRQRRVTALLVGLPLDHQQQPTRQADHCRRYGLNLLRALADHDLHLPLAWIDEHSSSWAAAERFGLHGDRSGRLDSAAAALLLEQWLREGPEPVGLAESTPDPIDPAAMAAGLPTGAGSF